MLAANVKYILPSSIITENLVMLNTVSHKQNPTVTEPVASSNSDVYLWGHTIASPNLTNATAARYEKIL
jgi:hypothetical protein